MSGEEETIGPGDVGSVADVLGDIEETTAEVAAGDYLFCEEDGSLYEFVAFQGDNISLLKEDGSSRVYPFKGKGYTFYVVSPEAKEQLEKDLAAIEKAKAELNVTKMLLEKL